MVWCVACSSLVWTGCGDGDEWPEADAEAIASAGDDLEVEFPSHDEPAVAQTCLASTVPGHLASAQLFVDGLTDVPHAFDNGDTNLWGSPSVINWQNFTGTTVAAPFFTLSLLHSDPTIKKSTLTTWWGSQSPNSAIYFDQVIQEQHFVEISNISEIARGDVFVANYLDAMAPTGHLAIIEACPVPLPTTAVANMGTPRRDHTATTLPDGRVLVTGSCCSSSSAELYDPDTNTWSPAASMSRARNGSTATLLPSGKVLIAGTYLPDPSATTEIYDPATNSWAPAASMVAARAYNTATTLQNGEILHVGVDKFTSCCASETTERYDPQSDSWSSAGNLSVARSAHSATLLPDGRVLVVGGYDEDEIVHASAELYLGGEVWEPAASMSTPRSQHKGAALLQDGRVLVAGGNPVHGGLPVASAELYDPDSNTWTPAANMLEARLENTVTRLPNGKVLLAGGINSANTYSASAELYDPDSDTWSSAGSLSVARYGHAAALLDNGKVLIVGGYDGSNRTRVDLYDPDSNTWSVPLQPLIPDTTQYAVGIIDSTSTAHGCAIGSLTADTRWVPNNPQSSCSAGATDGGAGRGTLRIYAISPGLPGEGTITGYSWSITNGSHYYDQASARPHAIGRFVR